VTLRVLGTTQVGGGAGTEYVRAALGNAGVKATLENTDTTTWARKLFGGGADWDVTVMAVADPASLRGPASHFAGSPPPSGTNLPSIDSPAFQHAFAAATRTPGAAGCAAWADAQRALVGEAHTQPLTTLPAVAAWSGVSGGVVAGYILSDTIVTR
jgi:peptide/nickel transport system substrate-binding protein